MGKFKTLGVIAAMLLCGTTVFANNFRGGDQVYVPAAGHVGGGGGVTFVSDLFFSNLESDVSVDVSVTFTTGTNPTTSQVFKNRDGSGFTLTLAPKERREIIDFIAAPKSQGGLGLPSGFGTLLINACLAGQTCTPDLNTGTNPNFRNISVESRIYSFSSGTPTSAATNGQLFAGFGWYSYASSDGSGVGLDKVFITGLRNTGAPGTVGTYRGNIGLVNASQFSTTTLVLQLFDGKTGAQIGSTQQVTLGPLGISQPSLSALFPSFTGSTATNAWVLIQQPAGSEKTGDADDNGCGNGCPAFFAYGSVLDNGTGDATTLEAQYTKPLSDNAINCIYNATCKGSFNPKRAAKH